MPEPCSTRPNQMNIAQLPQPQMSNHRERGTLCFNSDRNRRQEWEDESRVVQPQSENRRESE